MQVVKPAADHEVPRGVVGGAEVSEATTGAREIYLGIFRVEPSARSRPHYHASCETAVYMLRGAMDVQWGDELQHTTTLSVGDMAY
ncbi:MAG: cupin protein, partial [Solirubrobacterales bacterium]|nr:cupin protein [Solirubrobacterales bacterium]